MTYSSCHNDKSEMRVRVGGRTFPKTNDSADGTGFRLSAREIFNFVAYIPDCEQQRDKPD
jgi:hypothetical protein